MRSKNGVMKCNELVGRFFSRGILFPATALAMLLSTAGILPAQGLALDNFEGPELVNWNIGGSDKPFQLSLNKDPRYVKEGKQSLRVECRYPNQQHTQLNRYLSQDPERKSWLKLTPETDTLSFWMYVESGDCTMTMILDNSKGGDGLRAPGFRAFPSGTWQRIIVRPDQWNGGAAKAKENWSGSSTFAPVIHGKVTLYIDDMRFIAAKDVPAELKAGSIAATPAARAYVNDLAGVLEGKTYVVPGLRVPKPLSVDHTFPKPSRGNYPSRDKGMPVDLFVELPSEIQVTAVMDNNRAEPCWLKEFPAECKVAVLAEKKNIVRDGQPLIQYRWELPYAKSRANSLPVFFETTLAPGQERIGYYYLAWKGGAQPPQSMKFVSIDIPPVPRLKKFAVGMYQFKAHAALQYFPDFPKDFLRLGLNSIGVDGMHGGEQVPPGEEVINKARAAGIFLRWGDDFWPRRPGGAHSYWDWAISDPDARAVDIDGKIIYMVGGEGTHPVLCPSYRGKLFEEGVGNVLTSGMIEKYGITWFACDIEMPKGEQKCFCDRCLAKWPEFRKQHYPALPETSPKEFMRDPVKNYDLHTAWIDFKCYQYADMFLEMKRRWAPALAKVKTNSNPWPGIILDDWGWCGAVFTRKTSDESLKNRYWAEAFNIAQVGLYGTIDSTAMYLHEYFATNAYFNGQKRILGCPTSGQNDPADVDRANPPKWMKYTIMESAAAGLLGVNIFSISGMDGIKFKYMADGLRIIQPVEDLVIEGLPIKDITAASTVPKVRANGIERGAEALISVSAYTTEEGKEVSVEVRYPVKSARKVVDLETRKEIGLVTPENPKFNVTLKEDRVRLFYVGNKLGSGK